MGKQSQLLLKPTEVELVLQVGMEFDKRYLNLIFRNSRKVSDQFTAEIIFAEEGGGFQILPSQTGLILFSL